MAAFVTVILDGKEITRQFHVKDNLGIQYPGVKHDNIVSVQLDGHELSYAIEVLGAHTVQGKRVFTYFGDNAREIFFNW